MNKILIAVIVICILLIIIGVILTFTAWTEGYILSAIGGGALLFIGFCWAMLSDAKKQEQLDDELDAIKKENAALTAQDGKYRDNRIRISLA